MGGGSPSPSPAGSPRGHSIEFGDLANALNNCRIQPADPGSSAVPAAAMPTCTIGGFSPSCGSPCQHQKHKLKCHLKIKHRHHGPPKMKHRHHEHIKIKHRHHIGGEDERHMFPHCHPMNAEAHLGCGFHHHGRPHHHHHHPPGHHGHHHHHHQMRQRRHGQCCSHGYHHFFTGPMADTGHVAPPPQG